MMGFFIFIHTVCCLLLIATVLMQSGRGGGLTEGFASAESMFGARTNEFMVRTTVVLSSVFLVTSLALAHLSAKKEQSLIPEEAADVRKAADKVKVKTGNSALPEVVVSTNTM